MSPWFAIELLLDFALPLLLAALGFYLIRRSIPKSKIKSTPICRACAYNLTGVTASACPECGFTTTPTRKQIFRLVPKKRVIAGLLLTLPMLWVLWMFLTFYSWVLPLQYNLNNVIQRRLSGAVAKVNWQFPHFEDTRSDTWWDKTGIWLSAQAVMLWGPNQLTFPDAQFEARRLTRKHNITLDPTLIASSLPLRLTNFTLQWLFWPGEHYRRYVKLLDEPPTSVVITDVTPKDQDLFDQIAGIGPFKELQVISSHIDGDSLHSISRLTAITYLNIQAVTAPMPELLQLKNLPNLENLSIDFGRPISPHDIQTLDTLPRLTTLTLTAHQVQPGCDAALAKLALKPTLWRLKLNVPLNEKDFPLTLTVIRDRFDDSSPDSAPQSVSKPIKNQKLPANPNATGSSKNQKKSSTTP